MAEDAVPACGQLDDSHALQLVNKMELLQLDDSTVYKGESV